MALLIDLPFPGTTSQLQRKGNPQLVLNKEQCKINANSLFILAPSLMSLYNNNIFTTVEIKNSNFQRTTENIDIIESYEEELDVIVPLKVNKRLTKSANIKYITKYIPKVIID